MLFISTKNKWNSIGTNSAKDIFLMLTSTIIENRMSARQLKLLISNYWKVLDVRCFFRFLDFLGYFLFIIVYNQY